MSETASTSFHGISDLVTWSEVKRWTETTLSYTFTPHFHPYVQELFERLVSHSVRGLQDADTEIALQADGSPEKLPDGKTPRPALYRDLFDAKNYNPTSLVAEPYPKADLDFTGGGAYSIYNWELFFHIPITIAVHLSRNGRFEEAQQWFHYVFEPTTNEEGTTPERFWKTKPFRTTDAESIESILTNLSSEADSAVRDRTITSINAWQRDPFRPHLVARHRPAAYMLYTVMAYLDNLIAWGDALFQQDTGESVADATQLYVIAANILGPRPQQVPTKGTVLPQTYASLKRLKLDRFSNALVKLETAIPFDQAPAPGPAAGNGPGGFGVLGRTLYFCVPGNDKLLAYWDIVADRLFKIRNSLSLAGVFRQLPTFDPPIDPALLARATAAGVDVAAVVAGVNQPAPLVRFSLLASKAAELCQEVKNLGGALLSAIEKQDGETLAALRAKHETAMLELARTVRYAQWQEAVKNREALEASLAIARARYTFYELLLGRQVEDIRFEDVGALDTAGLDKESFTATEPAVPQRAVDIEFNPSATRKLSPHEARELAQLDASQVFQDSAALAEFGAGLLHLIPVFAADVKPFGIGAGGAFGGPNVAGALSGVAAGLRGIAGRFAHEASKAGKLGGYARREQDWQMQSNAAAGDITQINKQLRATQIREFIAQREYRDHGEQIKQAQEIEQFLAGEKRPGKTTTTAYYALLRREVRGLYNQCYQLAVEIARKAERALHNELGDTSLTFIQPSYLAGPEGLLAGEKLHMDIRRMELAYLDRNRREYELTKHVSLLQVAPWALVTLRTTGRCSFAIPEEAFDLDTPGHYFRRIRSVAITLPCITGPYTGIACTARLLRSRIRTSPLLAGTEYAANPDGDPRFEEQLGFSEAIVTSSGSSDSGRFTDNPRDDRLLPFEYRGVIGEWQLELPADPRPFDYDTITDAVLHLQYTAREGGEPLRQRASANLRDLITAGRAAGSVRLLSARHEFPSAWAQFENAPAGDGKTGRRAGLVLDLRREHYPFFAGATPSALAAVELLARPSDRKLKTVTVADRAVDTDEPKPAEEKKTRSTVLTPQPGLAGFLRGSLGATPAQLPDTKRPWDPLPQPTGALGLYFDTSALEDLFIFLTWNGPTP